VFDARLLAPYRDRCDDLTAMPSQFSTLGFDVKSGEDLAALASRLADRASIIDVEAGHYLKWAPPTGEQLWLQITRSGDAMGMTPHFAGRSAVRIAIEARVARPNHTPLEGTFLAWLNPPDDGTAGGDVPFAFDCPDAATHRDLVMPATATAQLAAFAQRITLHESSDDYDADQDALGQAFPSRSFIPSGLISPSGEPVTPPEPHALIAGHIVDAALRRNSLTGHPFWWMLVETVGGGFDVVADPALLPRAPRAGNVLSGWCWLSGRLVEPEVKPRGGWLSRLRNKM
jgi:hypothetical protein